MLLSYSNIHEICCNSCQSDAVARISIFYHFSIAIIKKDWYSVPLFGAMAVPSIDQLRGLQASLNSAIDSYVENAKQTQAAGSQRLVGDKTRISAVASRIVDAVKNPIADITALGLQVNRTAFVVKIQS